MGISAYDPVAASRGPTNAKRAAVERMLTQHGFVQHPNAGDSQHVIFQHSVYSDISTKVTGHKGSDLKAATVEAAGKACLKVLARQEAERQAFSEQALAAVKDTPLAALIGSDTVTVERIDEDAFLLRDAKYPELGLTVNSKAVSTTGTGALAAMRVDHMVRLGKLEARGLTVQADGIHPTLIRDPAGTEIATLPLYDGQEETLRKLNGQLKAAKRVARGLDAGIEEHALALLERTEALSVELVTQDIGQERHVSLRDMKAPEGDPVFFSESEAKGRNTFSVHMLERLEEALVGLEERRIGQQAADEPLLASKAYSVAPPAQEERTPEQAFDDLYRTLRGDGFKVIPTFRNNDYVVALRHSSFPGYAEIIIKGARPPVTMDFIRVQRSQLSALIETFFKHQLASGYYTQHTENGVKRFVYPPESGGQTVVVPPYAPDRSIKAELEQLEKVSRAQWPGICEDETRLLTSMGYKQQGRRLKDSGPPSSMSSIALPDLREPHSVHAFVTAARERRILFYSGAQNFLKHIGYVCEGRKFTLHPEHKDFAPLTLPELGDVRGELAFVEGIARTRQAFYKNVDSILISAGYLRCEGQTYVAPKGLHPGFEKVTLPAENKRKGDARFLQEYDAIRGCIDEYGAAGDELIRALQTRKPVRWYREKGKEGDFLIYQWDAASPVAACPLIEDRPSFAGLQEVLAAYKRVLSPSPMLAPLAGKSEAHIPLPLARANGAALRQ